MAVPLCWRNWQTESGLEDLKVAGEVDSAAACAGIHVPTDAHATAQGLTCAMSPGKGRDISGEEAVVNDSAAASVGRGFCTRAFVCECSMHDI